MNKKKMRGNWNLVTATRGGVWWASLLLAAFASTSVAGAQTAILECPSGVRQAGQVKFSFRTGPAAKMKPAAATLVVHLASGAAPESIEILKPRRVRVEARADDKGWITIRIPPDIAARLIAKTGEWLAIAEPPGTLFDLPSRAQFAPYLVVEADAAKK